MKTQARVRDFIFEELNWNGEPAKLTDDYPLLENRVLDSLGIFTLVSYLEDEFGIEVADQELVPDNFGTIRKISELVDGKRSTVS
jgi:acyl carrier protein